MILKGIPASDIWVKAVRRNEPWRVCRTNYTRRAEGIRVPMRVLFEKILGFRAFFRVVRIILPTIPCRKNFKYLKYLRKPRNECG
jgi:hypothetical protein